MNGTRQKRFALHTAVEFYQCIACVCYVVFTCLQANWLENFFNQFQTFKISSGLISRQGKVTTQFQFKPCIWTQRLDLLLIHALAAALKMPLFSAKTFFQVIGRGPESKMKKATLLCLGQYFPNSWSFLKTSSICSTFFPVNLFKWDLPVVTNYPEIITGA